jgi:hypothetical protein
LILRSKYCSTTLTRQTKTFFRTERARAKLWPGPRGWLPLCAGIRPGRPPSRRRGSSPSSRPPACTFPADGWPTQGPWVGVVVVVVVSRETKELAKGHNEVHCKWYATFFL